jgi:hypothetical protein
VDRRRILTDPLDLECRQGYGAPSVGCYSHHVFLLLTSGYATEAQENQHSMFHRYLVLMAELTEPSEIAFQNS